jgi:hypothetical protein
MDEGSMKFSGVEKGHRVDGDVARVQPGTKDRRAPSPCAGGVAVDTEAPR